MCARGGFLLKSLVPLILIFSLLAACAPRSGSGVGADGSEDSKPADPACAAPAVSALKQYSLTGYQTWARIEDKSEFNQYLTDCANKTNFYLYEVPTSVHESNHDIRFLTQNYHLISNEMLPVPPTPGYFPPREMAKDLAADLKTLDDYFEIYIASNSEKSSSKDDFTYLLDELNAYTNDARTTEDMYKIVPYDGNRQAGLPAMMAFVAYYAEYASLHHPEVYEHMSENMIMRSALARLWDQAEQTLIQSCDSHPESLNDSSYYVSLLCNGRHTMALTTALGRAPACPSQCKSSGAKGAVRTVRRRTSVSFETR